MAKIEINPDAYCLAGESLFRVRQLTRETLRAAHGEDWPQQGIPEELRGYLLSRRAREASINWHLSESADLLDYAGFANIYDIIAANEELLELFASLAPDPDVLRLRFLELDTILNRIAYMRPVADSEMGFLVTFDERIRRIAAPAGGVKPPTSRPAVAKTAPRKEARPAAEGVDRQAAPEPPPAPAPPGKAETAKTAAAERPPASRSAEAHPPAAEQKPAGPPSVERNLDEALLAGKDTVVLAALYREITGLADGLWTQAAPAFPIVWEKVRESDWYNERFSRLGLKSVSEFYSLVEEARERLVSGTSRNDLQEFLKERNFAQVLLSLRELFRHHLAS